MTMIPRPIILGIESSCDETAAAVVEGGRYVISNVVATQHDLHEQYAGVVPEIASRAHLERILPVLQQAMSDAELSYEDLDAIAVGHRPGLIGSLLVGVAAAKALAWALRVPIIGVDHVVAHLHSVTLDAAPIEFPALGLVVSGGHTSLYLMKGPLNLILLGKTIDDAAGEAFDKAATILGLGYPGGPVLDQTAQSGDEHAHDFPISLLDSESLDFSFSGLKTALLYAVRGMPKKRGGGDDSDGDQTVFERDADDLTDREKADFAASFQRAAIGALIAKIIRALDQFGDGEVKSLVIGGGVSANSRLRSEAARLAASRGLALRLPDMRYCVDNAAMIAGLAAERYCVGDFDDLSLSASTSPDPGPEEQGV